MDAARVLLLWSAMAAAGGGDNCRGVSRAEERFVGGLLQ
jgi:hypothetical protein